MYVRLILVIFSIFSNTEGDPSKILPCYAASPSGTVQPSTIIYYTTLYDCLMTCINTALVCSSVIWDDRQHNCYMFAQTARTNPGILLNRYGTVYYERLPDAGPNCGGGAVAPIGPNVTQAPVVVPPTGGLSCPQKINTAYFVAVGSAISNAGNDSTVVSGLTEENDCLAACTDQINPKTKGSLGCTALSTVRSGSDVQCTFGTTVSQPDGPAALSRNPNSFFFQKFCVPAGSPSTCFEEFFYLFPQMTLDGHTISSQNSIKSLVDCTNLCITTANCKSAVYDSGTSICILKDALGKGDPGFRNSSSNVYYVENGCLNKPTAASGAGPAPSASASSGPAAGQPSGRALSERNLERGRAQKHGASSGENGSDLEQFVEKSVEHDNTRTTGPDFPKPSAFTIDGPPRAFVPIGRNIDKPVIPIPSSDFELDSPIRENINPDPKSMIILMTEFATPRPLNSKLADVGSESILSFFASHPTHPSARVDDPAELTDSFLSHDGNWGRWSACTFTIGGRRSRIRSRNCLILSQCLDKNIEHDACSYVDP